MSGAAAELPPMVMLSAGVTSGLTSFAIAAVVRRFAGGSLIDVPNERSSHRFPTARGGGIGLVAGTALGCVAATALMPVSKVPWLLLLGGVLIATVSFVDDLRSLSVPVRLAVHCVAAGFALFVVGSDASFEIPGVAWPLPAIAGRFLWFVWIVGLTNAYNFMDGIDGIAVAQAIVAGAAWLGVGWVWGEPEIALFGALLGAASLGFLPLNWAPARIFMGDVGSAFLGYLFAVIPVLAASRRPSANLIGLLVVWPFVFDTAFTFCRRLVRGENVFHAHRMHIYQRLTQTGLSHAAVALLYCGLAALGAVVALALAMARSTAVAGLGSAVIVAAAILTWLGVRRRERQLTADFADNTSVAGEPERRR